MKVSFGQWYNVKRSVEKIVEVEAELELELELELGSQQGTGNELTLLRRFRP